MLKHIIGLLDRYNSRAVGKVVVIAVLLLLSIFIVTMLIMGVKPVSQESLRMSEYEQILLARAKELFQQKKLLGISMDSGPCLTNELDLEWVADVVHVPREAVDNVSENQCSAYLEKNAKHIIELDTQGELVRIE